MQSFFISRHQKTKIIVLVSFPCQPPTQPKSFLRSLFWTPCKTFHQTAKLDKAPKLLRAHTHSQTYFWKPLYFHTCQGSVRSVFNVAPSRIHHPATDFPRAALLLRPRGFLFARQILSIFTPSPSFLAISGSLRRKATFLIILKVIKKNLCSKRKLSLPSSTVAFPEEGGRERGAEKQVLRKSHCKRCATFPPFGVVCWLGG